MKKIMKWQLQQRQGLPLDIKIRLTERRIISFYEKFDGNVYVAFSGGLDSTVLLHIARRLYPDIRAVYCDTWMEYPQVREFVYTHGNVICIKPEKSMKEIIKDRGWCFPSKEVAELIEGVRSGKDWAVKKIDGLTGDGEMSAYRKRYKKWKFLVDCPCKISKGCCLDMKEKPVAKFEKEHGLHPLLGLLAEESAQRKEGYLRTGCNVYDDTRPSSKPIGFWRKQDILEYIVLHQLKIPSVYGDIYPAREIPGQMSLFNEFCAGCTLKMSGEQRTGCMFCPVGCHLDNFSKFTRLRKFNPVLYEYCMEELGLKELLCWLQQEMHLGKVDF